MRKYNKIISCKKNVHGAWVVLVQTPNDQFYRHTYMGYSRRDVSRKVRATNFDVEAIPVERVETSINLRQISTRLFIHFIAGGERTFE